MLLLSLTLGVQLVKNPSAMQETLVQFLGQEDLLEKGQATHSSILAWRIQDYTVHGVIKSLTRLSDFHFHLLMRHWGTQRSIFFAKIFLNNKCWKPFFYWDISKINYLHLLFFKKVSTTNSLLPRYLASASQMNPLRLNPVLQLLTFNTP